MEGKVLGISIADRGADAAADDLKYICGLFTILVSTIQEIKDRVSQTEFILCTQLFPHIQAQSKATKAAEDDWRKREAVLVSQLEDLSCGKRRAEGRLLQLESSLEEMKGKLADAARLAAEHDAEKKQLLGRLKELDRLLRLESSFEEIKEKLVDAVRLATEHDAEKKQFLVTLEEMKKDEVIRQLKSEIGDKAAEISREREAHQLLLHQMESKDNDLLLAQNKANHVTTKYKDLRSQYSHLLKKKFEQNEGSKSPVNRKTSGSRPSKRKLKGTTL
jgi:chromosome segregation ATPase